MTESLRGHLLIASPLLSDYFRRTVILMIEHSAEGALGVVLNRPSELVVGEAVPSLGDLAGDDEPVYIGGPVQPESVLALGEFGEPDAASKLVIGPVGVVDPEAPSAGSLQRTRIYAGYAGWGPGQLEAELEEDAWIIEPARPQDPWDDDDLWSDALRRKGGEYGLLASMPADPSMN
jgi:putative transcriptional regulator